MTSSGGLRLKTLPVASIDLEVDGELPPQAKASFVKELAKYLLYDRNQIPDPLDQIRKQQSETKSCLQRPSLAQRRRTIFLSQIDTVFSFIDDVCALPEPPKLLALIFGSTIVSPKESYLIEFPDVYPGEPFVSRVDSVLRKLLCKIVGEDLIGKLKGHTRLSAVVPSTLHVAVRTSRFAQFGNPHLFRPHLNGLDHLKRKLVVSLKVTNVHRDFKSRETFESSSNGIAFRPFCDDGVDSDSFNIDKLDINSDEQENENGMNHKKATGKQQHSHQNAQPCADDKVWYICTSSVKGLRARRS